MNQIQKIMILTSRKNKLFVFLVLSTLLLPLFSQAQNSLSLSVSPTVFQMTANPSQQLESTLRIINVNSFDLKVYAEAVNFRPLGEGGAAQFIPVDDTQNDSSSFAEWITVTNEEIIVPAEQTIQIPITINLPTDAPPGGHYAAVLIGTRPPKNTGETTKVETSQIVSTLLFLRVNGDIRETGNIRSFRTTKSLLSTPAATFELRFENTGNVHLQPQGEIKILNMWGQERGLIPINQKTLSGNVLSDSIRSYNFTWTGEWSPADIGRYTAEATLAYGEEARQFTSSETAFWVIPWKILLGFVLVIAFIVFITSWLIKLYIRRMLAVAGLDDIHSKNMSTTRSRRRAISVTAPIEVGILDLRSQLKNRTSNLETVSILWKFIKVNKALFLAVAVVIVILYSIVWYAHNASKPDRSYEITIENFDSNIKLNSEQIQYEALEKPTATTSVKRNAPPIEIVNKSGVNGAAAELAIVLEELGYSILGLRTDFSDIQERTIVVYDPNYANDSLELSTVLNNALLSSFESENSDEPTMTILLGQDIANR